MQSVFFFEEFENRSISSIKESSSWSRFSSSKSDKLDLGFSMVSSSTEKVRTEVEGSSNLKSRKVFSRRLQAPGLRFFHRRLLGNFFDRRIRQLEFDSISIEIITVLLQDIAFRRTQDFCKIILGQFIACNPNR